MFGIYMDCGGFSVCFHFPKKQGGELAFSAPLVCSRRASARSCPSHPCPFKSAMFRFGAIHVPCARCSCMTNCFLLRRRSLTGSRLAGPSRATRRCRGLWETSGRLQAGRVGSGFVHLPHLTTTTPPPPPPPPSCSRGSI